MCLILFSYADHPVYYLALAANRDEFFNRPTQDLRYWDDYPEVLAGRDLKNNGTWMGMTRTGRIAAITNYRDPFSLKDKAPSRGHLVKDFLTGHMSPQTYLEQIDPNSDQFNGFNLIVGDATGLFYYSNMAKKIQKITPGLHGLSNHLLDTPWPKVVRGKNLFTQTLQQKVPINIKNFIDVLSDRNQPSDKDLPDTGVGKTWERLLSSIFITSEIYGTRCSSILLIEKSGKVVFSERSYHYFNQDEPKIIDREFKFTINQQGPTS